MSVFASSNRFSLDALDVLRPAGEAAVVATTPTDNSYALEILQAYWAAGDLGTQRQFALIFTTESLVAGGATFAFQVEVATTAVFTTPVVVGGPFAVSAAGSQVVIPIAREDIVTALGGPDASLVGYLRGKVVVTGGTTPSVGWNCFIAPLV